MKVPGDCPHSIEPPPRDAAETISCCRAQARYHLLREDEEPLGCTVRTEAEVYRFTWRSSFGGDAVVRIGRQGDAITLRYGLSLFAVRGRRSASGAADDVRLGPVAGLVLGARPG